MVLWLLSAKCGSLLARDLRARWWNRNHCPGPPSDDSTGVEGKESDGSLSVSPLSQSYRTNRPGVHRIAPFDMHLSVLPKRNEHVFTVAIWYACYYGSRRYGRMDTVQWCEAVHPVVCTDDPFVYDPEWESFICCPVEGSP